MAAKGDPDLLAQVRAELRSAQEEAALAHARLGTSLTRVNEAIRALELASEPFAPSPSGAAKYPAGKRQALFYWALFIAGGEPDGDLVAEPDIAASLQTLTLEGNPPPSVSQLRERLMSRRGIDFIHVEIQGLYRLLPPAIAAMERHVKVIGGIPTPLSAKFHRDE